jgi:hypothetical protein
MSCDKPGDGSCTNVSPCGNSGCGCSSPTPSPVLPRCQDVSLTPGTFARATIVVNAQGCITSITEGEPELYAPDECCGDGSGGSGSGEPGEDGEDGEDGLAATVAIVPTIETGTGSAWLVENIGNQTAAIFKFTSPAPILPEAGTTGETGTLDGFVFENGLVKQIPSAVVTKVTLASTGTKASLVTVTGTPNTAQAGRFDFALNVDALHADLKALIDAQATRISDLTAVVADLRNEFDDYVATHP